jgi:hypothetical protein
VRLDVGVVVGERLHAQGVEALLADPGERGLLLLEGALPPIYESFWGQGRGHTAHRSVRAIGYEHELREVVGRLKERHAITGHFLVCYLAMLQGWGKAPSASKRTAKGTS